MPGVEPSSRVAALSIETPKELSKQFDKLYERLANGINTKTDTIVRDVAPTSPLTASTDYQYEIGTHWIDQTNNKVYVLTSRPTVVTATWIEVS